MSNTQKPGNPYDKGSNRPKQPGQGGQGGYSHPTKDPSDKTTK